MTRAAVSDLPKIASPALPQGGGALEGAVRARVLPPPRRPELEEAARELVAAAEGEVVGLVFFGSRRTQAAKADAHSAYDLFVIVRRYGAAYRALRRAGRIAKPPSLLAALNRILPPNQISQRLGQPPLHAKCSVITLGAFLRETSRRRRDHFCIGRLFQPSQILYAKDVETGRLLLDALVAAHQATYEWSRPWLPSSFDADLYGRTLLAVSLAHEIRPEPEGRAEALWRAQREEQQPVFAALLSELGNAGELRVLGERTANGDPLYELVRPPSFAERLRLRAYFASSLVRATVRWLKHMLTFEDWLDYILHKVKRHAGEEIVLTERERKYPLLFLWPRVVRYLRGKDARRP